MKKKCLYLLVCLFTGIYFSSCNNDFLNEKEDEPQLSITIRDTVYVDNTQLNSTCILTFSLPELKNSRYKILQFPSWIEFNSLHGTFDSNGITELQYQVHPPENNFLGYKEMGTLILEMETGTYRYISIFFCYENVGNPALMLSTISIDFGQKSKVQYISLYNYQSGLLRWKILEAPEWIAAGSSQGTILTGPVEIALHCRRADLTPGSYTGEVVIQSNDRNNPIQKIDVRMEVLEMGQETGIYAIKGTVAGSCFDKERGLLYVAAKSPDNLLIYDVKAGPDKLSCKEIALNRAPSCISLSEDGKLILIGSAGQLSAYNTQSGTFTHNIDLDFNVFDVVYGENGYCYMTPDTEENVWEALYYINLATGEIKNKHSDHIYVRSRFRKVKGSPLLLSTRNQVYPSGLTLIDISGGTPGTELYWHEELNKQFWMSEDGKYIYTGANAVIETPDLTTGRDIYPITYFSNSHRTAGWVDHNQQTNTLWFVEKPDSWGYGREIFKVDVIGYYLLQQRIEPSDYVTTLNGVRDYYLTCVHYLFTNKTGNYLYLVKNLSNVANSGMKTNYNDWSIEVVQVY